MLIGFSFGADVLPFLVSRLPTELAADVSLLSAGGMTGLAKRPRGPGAAPADQPQPLVRKSA